MQPAAQALGERLNAVRERIARAAERAHRDPQTILLLAVTKVFPATVIEEAYALGLREFGENYVQELEGKYGQVHNLEGVRFHLIGHLQLFDVVQTVDSAKLARRLSDAGRSLEVMLEVKLAPEEAKSGAAPEELPKLIAAVQALARLRLTGLMTMPPWSDDPEASRPYFRRLRELAERHGLPQLVAIHLNLALEQH